MITMTTLCTSVAPLILRMIILVSINLVLFYISWGGREREKRVVKEKEIDLYLFLSLEIGMKCNK